MRLLFELCAPLVKELCHMPLIDQLYPLLVIKACIKASSYPFDYALTHVAIA
jgi:hypothetical protein